MTSASTASVHIPAGPVSPKSQQEMTEKLKSLKRRFDELEQEYSSDGNRSNERNVRMREEQDHLRTEITEIEQKIQKTNVHLDRTNQVQKELLARKLEGNGRTVMNGNTLECLSNAATSPQVRGSSQTGQQNPPSQNRTHASVGVVQAKEAAASPSSRQAPNGNAAQISPRASQRIATRKSQRQAGGNSSIAAVAAAAAQAEAVAITVTTQPPSLPPIQGSTTEDVQMVDTTTTQRDTNTTAALAALPNEANSFANFSHAPSMESIVRVAEAAVAAQNAAKLAAAPQPSTSADPNLDPSLLAESSNLPSSKPSVPNSDTAANASNTPALGTISTSNKASDSTTDPSPTSSTSLSNLSNNPYLALATNYQRGGTTSPTGHPMLFPYPLFYPAPSPPVTPGTPTGYPVPYNPYYYMPPPMVNGMYSSPPGFPSQAQPASPQPTQQKTSPQMDQQQGVKPKRLKSHTVTTKSFSIPMVPRDKKGKPMLPLNVGIMTVISLGTVCMRDHFHTERYIFPVGYEVTRRYLSTLDPNAEVVYHCTILDGGDGPKFQIIPSDRPDKPIIAGTATGAWSSIVKQANAIRNRQHSNSVSGPDFFGLGQNTIKHLIQELPNADKLRDYVWQNFVEGGPLGGRHAAVIPALPEEYDASLPIGAYYPRRNEAPDPNLPRGLSYYPQHIIAQAEAQRTTKTAQSEPIAGPSGTSSSSVALNGSQTQRTAATPQRRTVSDGSRLVIQEYQPPQQQPISAPSAVQTSEEVPQTQKRVTRSRTAAANATATASTSASASATSARHTKSASKGKQNHRQSQQQPQQKPLPVPVVSPPIDADGTTPMTFADIMKAYPGPPLTSPTSASVGPTSSARAGS